MYSFCSKIDVKNINTNYLFDLIYDIKEHLSLSLDEMFYGSWGREFNLNGVFKITIKYVKNIKETSIEISTLSDKKYFDTVFDFIHNELNKSDKLFNSKDELNKKISQFYNN
ncbi:hypothetical protein FC831_13865 [Clostridium botulinum]|nr:hypothetical protein [Clostridium botulinum]